MVSIIPPSHMHVVGLASARVVYILFFYSSCMIADASPTTPTCSGTRALPSCSRRPRNLTRSPRAWRGWREHGGRRAHTPPPGCRSVCPSASCRLQPVRSLQMSASRMISWARRGTGRRRTTFCTRRCWHHPPLLRGPCTWTRVRCTQVLQRILGKPDRAGTSRTSSRCALTTTSRRHARSRPLYGAAG